MINRIVSGIIGIALSLLKRSEIGYCVLPLSHNFIVLRKPNVVDSITPMRVINVRVLVDNENP